MSSSGSGATGPIQPTSTGPTPVSAPAHTPAPEPKFFASVYPGSSQEISKPFGKKLKAIQNELGMPLWLLIQNSDDDWGHLSFQVFKGIQEKRDTIAAKEPVALLIESPGGSAGFAYHIARMFQRRASDFVVLVPQYAKSAATLLALGATRLVMAPDAELGPLDVQIFDPEREQQGSALETVQSLERLNAFVLTAVDQLVPLIASRSGKKIETVTPWILSYACDFVRPLLEKIDTVDFTKKSRELKEAEEYAARLMQEVYGWSRAKQIARRLVEKYPTHGFVIDCTEAGSPLPKSDQDKEYGLGLNIESPAGNLGGLLEDLVPDIDRITAVGQFIEEP